MTLWMSKFIHWIQRYSDICFEVSWFVQSQLIWPHDWIGLEKLPQNDPLNVKICPLDPKIQWLVIFVFKSADLYSHSWSDLTIGLASKNYPKMTLWMSKSVHWIQRYSDIYCEVSWFVQSQLIVPHDWIGLEKLPQNDLLNVQIRPLDQKIQWYLFWSQLICTDTADCSSGLDWP